eukprot:scaffold1000_cov166-Amphora_coffeaeformis.AAC.33
MSVWDLVVAIIAYFVTSLGGVAIVKFLNYHFCFSSWLILALLSRAAWLFAVPLAVYLRGRERNGGPSSCCLPIMSAKQLQIYVVVALGLSLVEVLNTMSMTVLPGSLYALIKGTDVVWSMILSRLVLHKSYSWYQVLAVIVIVVGIGAVVMKPPKTTESHYEATEKAMQAAHVANSSMAAAMCLLGAFCNSLLSVITEATLKDTLRAEHERMLSQTEDQQQPSKLVLSNEYAMWTSFFSFLLLIGTAVITGQFSGGLGTTNFEQLSCSDNYMAHTPASDSNSRAQWILLILSLTFVTLSRFAERLIKHWICVRDSAMTFSIVQAARRLLGVFVLAALFGEAFPGSMVAGSILAGMGFALHTWATLMKRDMDVNSTTPLTKEDRDYELVSLAPPTEIDELSEDEEEKIIKEC